MRHTIVIEVGDNATHAEVASVITRHVNNVAAYNTIGVRARVVEYHYEQMTEIADVETVERMRRELER
jgi:hypothetical protein